MRLYRTSLPPVVRLFRDDFTRTDRSDSTQSGVHVDDEIGRTCSYSSRLGGRNVSPCLANAYYGVVLKKPCLVPGKTPTMLPLRFEPPTLYLSWMLSKSWFQLWTAIRLQLHWEHVAACQCILNAVYCIDLSSSRANIPRTKGAALL